MEALVVQERFHDAHLRGIAVVVGDEILGDALLEREVQRAAEAGLLRVERLENDFVAALGVSEEALFVGAFLSFCEVVVVVVAVVVIILLFLIFVIFIMILRIGPCR